MTPAVYLAVPDMKVPIRRLPIYDYEIAAETILDLEVVASEDVDEARLSCDQTGWLHVSSDGGSNYDPIPDSAQTGVDFGPMTALDRTAIKIKVLIPALTAVRRRFVALNFGMGV